MVTKTLHIRVNPAMIRQFNQQGYKLCFATGVQTGGRVSYNVIASTNSVAANITIQWEDSYAIAGTLVDVATNTVGINLGQSYTLPQDFTDGPINDDSSAPKDGIRFVNRTGAAAAVLFKRINGQNAPIYISANAPLPPGTEDITPLSRVAVWFQNEAQTSMMISNLPGGSREMEMSFMTEATLEYTGSGSWVQV
ncbi:uncharacterized protein NECHADRAFT_81493 [Fusarium vanettenii 77-13-4]|uniref:Uncharacterized protein n=1 Tax=Fusarium vanettenii (strain ATCC MYA-4622 / CBS 123669 / FGSC 9596 / NRRL 45880 / 77-13-4) TaxID=660122 RepID=C7Z8J6_FUSV7|nr:uncharacterized protein NECHADRAFT_81493 [Fusarium vanettenii 77-13-4]EEU39377.1 hypothetical protein NECHADRAFT_81493 [Fusarium vanettenii 77-13-4]